MKKNPEARPKMSSGGAQLVSWKVPKRFGAKSLKEEALRKFSLPQSKVNVICTAKALDQGFDAPDVQLGIDASRTSNPTQFIQRSGRIARNYIYKDGSTKQGIYVCLYVPDTRDEDWLRKCQAESTNVLWVQDLDECKEYIKKLLGL